MAINMTDEQVLSKGFYRYPQISGFLSVKQYIFYRSGGKKCLLIRFSNDSDFTVTSMSYTLIQLDRSGEVLASTRAERSGLRIGEGETWADDRCAAVDDACTDFKLVFHEVGSGEYQYIVDGSAVSVRYVGDRSDEHRVKKQVSSAKPYRAYDLRRSVCSALFALIALALIAFAQFLVFSTYGDRDGAKENAPVTTSLAVSEAITDRELLYSDPQNTLERR